MNSPTKHQLGAVKRIIRYVAGTTDFGLLYKHVQSFKLVGYTDSDWGGSLEDRRSTSGNMFTLGSGAITWSSKKQDITALSTTEAECVAATSAACQGIWLRRLLEDMGQKQVDATLILCDNRSAIAIAKNPAMHGRTKHIDIRFHFIRSLITDGLIVMNHCSSDEQAADILTKSLTFQKHMYFTSLMGVCSFKLNGCVESN